MCKKLMAIMILSYLSLAAASRTQREFKDPLTGKSGLYTLALSQAVSGKQQGLLVFFHGSGNSAGYAGSVDGLAKLAQDFNLAVLAIQAPNQAMTWPEGSPSASNRHAEYVKSLIELEIYAKNANLNRQRLYLLGFSAGATFLSGDLLPGWITRLRGGAIMLCGGDRPIHFESEHLKPISRKIADGFPLYFFIQKRDFLYLQAKQGIDYWLSRQAQVLSETPEGGGHCVFDLFEETRKALKKIGA